MRHAPLFGTNWEITDFVAKLIFFIGNSNTFYAKTLFYRPFLAKIR